MENSKRRTLSVNRHEPPKLVPDVETLLAKLAKKVDRTKLSKALRMLKAERFQLYSDLQKDFMSGPLLRYKEAEAGDIDWRPTETGPEDYSAL